jgi:hypothetical protein
MTKFFSVLRYYLTTRKGLVEMVREIDYSASLDNRFGHKMLAVCYGVVLFGFGFSLWLS